MDLNIFENISYNDQRNQEFQQARRSYIQKSCMKPICSQKPTFTTQVAQRFTQRAGGNEEMSNNFKSLTNAKYIDLMKCLHDALHYSLKQIPVTIELYGLNKMFGDKSLNGYCKELYQAFRKLTKRRRNTIRNKFYEGHQIKHIEYWKRIQWLNRKLRKQRRKQVKQIEQTLDDLSIEINQSIQNLENAEKCNEENIDLFSLIMPEEPIEQLTQSYIDDRLALEAEIEQENILKQMKTIDKELKQIGITGADLKYYPDEPKLGDNMKQMTLSEFMKQKQDKLENKEDDINSFADDSDLSENEIKTWDEHIRVCNELEIPINTENELKWTNDEIIGGMNQQNRKTEYQFVILRNTPMFIYKGTLSRVPENEFTNIKAHVRIGKNGEEFYFRGLSNNKINQEEYDRLMGIKRTRALANTLQQQIIKRFETMIPTTKSIKQITDKKRHKKLLNMHILTFDYNKNELGTEPETEFADFLRIIRNTITEEIPFHSSNKYQISYVCEKGGRSTTFKNSYNEAMKKIVEDYSDSLILYEDDALIKYVVVRIRVPMYASDIIGGITTRNADKKLDRVKAKWKIISPHTKTNCLWVACSIAAEWDEAGKTKEGLLHSTKIQNMSGINLKRKIGTDNKNYGTSEDIQNIADHKGIKINLYNELYEIQKTYVPKIDKIRKEINIILANAHFMAMIENTKLEERRIVFKPQDPPRLELIKGGYKEKPSKRIIAYDLESYQSKIYDDKLGKILENEIDQIAYACGWGFIVYDNEIEYVKQHGYKIEEYMFEGEMIKVAFKYNIGDNCLNESLHEWTNDPIFNDAVFYAHNGGKYDLRLILGQSELKDLEHLKIDSKTTVELNSKFINMTVQNTKIQYKITKTNKNGKQINRTKNHTISFKDSMCLFVGKLADLCEDFRVPHRKLEEKIKIHELMNKETYQENWIKYGMEEYFVNDVLGLLEILESFNKTVIKESGISITNINTAASLSKKLYLKKYYEIKDIDYAVYTLDEPLDVFLRESFAGGRCENFVSYKLNGKIYYYDFTSLYPDVARYELPVGYPIWLVKPKEDINAENIKHRVKTMWNKRITERKLNNKKCFWKVKVTSPKAIEGKPLEAKPLIGIKENNRFLFKWFKEETEMTLYEDEILLAIDLGLDYKFEPVNAVLFNSRPILKQCMEELFVLKAQAKANDQPALEKLWKIVLNSLFGVWGLKKLGREGLEIALPEDSNWALDMNTDRLVDIEQFGNYIVTRRIKDLEVKDCNVAIASAITSYARMKLYKVIHDIETRGGKVYYCDTDSIITNYCIEEDKELNDKWIGPSQGKDLGTLKNEVDDCYKKINKKLENKLIPKPYFDEAVIVSPKLYIVRAEGGKIIKKAHKGYKENPEKGDIVTVERMAQLVNYEDLPEDRVMKQETTQWVGGNRGFMTDNVGVRLIKRTKKLRQTVNKGELQMNGEIKPFGYF